MSELEHLQKIILSIAKDIDSLCRKNGIQYYLVGGSCIGAVRHHGFIPWDDDLDIIMTAENYQRFIKLCKEQLDSQKYMLQEGLKDWPLNFSKIRLKGTTLHEPEDEYATEESHGIYVDIFKLDNVPSNRLKANLQYFFAKYYLCYQLACRGYRSATVKKKIMMALSAPMQINAVRNFVIRQTEKYNNQETEYLGFFYGRTQRRTAITHKNIYGTPRYVDFEDTKLPIPEHYHEYLTQMFGDYMKLPPVEQQKGLHLLSVDFGKY